MVDIRATTSSRPISWWADHVKHFHKVGSGYKAKCPSHPDASLDSLSLAEAGDGTLVHCFGGCEFADIFAAANGSRPSVIAVKTPAEITDIPDSEAGVHPWAEYTHVAESFWNHLGAVLHPDKIVFHFEGIDVTKTRVLKPRKDKLPFYFTPRGGTKPPLWPVPTEDNVKEVVYISEGESDCGCLRAGGFAAFSITTGAAGLPKTNPFPELERLGVKEVRIIYDADEPGRDGAHRLATIIPQSLTTKILDIGDALNPLLGEKDVRDLFLGCGTYQEFIAEIEDLQDARPTHINLMQLKDFMAMPKRESKWLVKDIFLDEVPGMVVGAPKIGKTWLCLDLAVSVATGTPFLNRFETQITGPVIYIAKEDPDYLLEDRFQKILIAKGLIEPSVNINGKAIEISFPGMKTDWPIFIDVYREFVFDQFMADELLHRVDEIHRAYGLPAIVVFDPLLRMIAEGTDDFRATDIAQDIYNRLLQPLTNLGIGSYTAHHTTKSGSAAYGSVGLPAFSHNTLYIRSAKPDTDGWVNTELEFKSAPPKEFSYRFGELDKRYEVETRDFKVVTTTVSTETAAAKVASLFRENPDTVYSTKDLASATGNEQNYIRGIVKNLIKGGIVQSIGLIDTDEGRKPEGFKLDPEYREESPDDE